MREVRSEECRRCEGWKSGYDVCAYCKIGGGEDMEEKIERLGDKIDNLLMDDEEVREILFGVAEEMLGWRPESDEDEMDPRYELYYGYVTMALVKGLARAIWLQMKFIKSWLCYDGSGERIG